ncbi:hypothetical protein, partial [Pseudomonas syringae group genomosp. 3]|uniref:hypothetical protein n=1 Tax=Pseudomonas syringae group genomosp. 3 TaxID=251701 RepID=UPI001F1835CF
MKQPFPHHRRRPDRAPGSSEAGNHCTKTTHRCCNSNTAGSFSTQLAGPQVTLWGEKTTHRCTDEKLSLFL